MRDKRLIHYILGAFILWIVAVPFEVYATHIRAGEITIQQQGPPSLRTFIITITGYLDNESPVRNDFGIGEMDFGDGSPTIVPRDSPFNFTDTDLTPEVGVISISVVHTFPSDGTFIISYQEANRNEGVLNIPGSVNVPFFVDTKLVVNTLIVNDTPILLIPPIDMAAIGLAFFHNPGAVDFEGDSLSFRIVPNRTTDGTIPPGFQFMNQQDIIDLGAEASNEAMTGPPTLTISNNPDSLGTLNWDAPGQQGEYNVAFVIEEWRRINGQLFLLSCVTRDMQIIVQESDNERPELILPPDICVIAGTNIEEEIMGTDPDGDQVDITAFGIPFLFPPSQNPAQLIPSSGFQDVPATVDFEWNTIGVHVQQAPYQVQFRIEDNPVGLGNGPPLVDFDVWNIQIIGPPPTGLTPEQVTESEINLTWDTYQFPDDANMMQVWRRIDSLALPDSCFTGVPENAYILINEQDIDDTNFTDDFEIEDGVNYCYRLVALYPDGSESVASMEACIIAEMIPEDSLNFATVITNVSVLETSETDGEMEVRWMPPTNVNVDSFPPPFSYQVLRSVGLVQGATALITPSPIADTFLIDVGLNTQEDPFNYQIITFDGSGLAIDTSAVASSPRLDFATFVDEIDLFWEAEVPWTNMAQDFPEHFVFRNRTNAADEDEFNLIGTANVLENGFFFTDDGSFADNGITPGLDPDLVYCYFITTQGSYGNPLIPEPLLNNSQIVCAQPNDLVPPCMPILAIENLGVEACEAALADQPCNFNDFANTLRWSVEDLNDCDLEIASFNVFFSPTMNENDFEFIANVQDTFFVHDNLESFAGCYRITAIDRSGNESLPSNIVCNDNCPNYELPNTFTPNVDGINETYAAFNSGTVRKD